VTHAIERPQGLHERSPRRLGRLALEDDDDASGSAPSQLRPTVETYNGKQYETFVLRKVVYFPTQAGQLSIGCWREWIPAPPGQRTSERSN
jgi:hypothetical protein